MVSILFQDLTSASHFVSSDCQVEHRYTSNAISMSCEQQSRNVQTHHVGAIQGTMHAVCQDSIQSCHETEVSSSLGRCC